MFSIAGGIILGFVGIFMIIFFVNTLLGR